MAGSRCRSQAHKRRCGPLVRSVTRPSSSFQAAVSRTLASRLWNKGSLYGIYPAGLRTSYAVCIYRQWCTGGVVLSWTSDMPSSCVMIPFPDLPCWVCFISLTTNFSAKRLFAKIRRLYIKSVPHTLNVACWKSVSEGGRECVRVVVVCPRETIHYALTGHFTARRVARVDSRDVGQDASEFPQGEGTCTLCHHIHCALNPQWE